VAEVAEQSLWLKNAPPHTQLPTQATAAAKPSVSLPLHDRSITLIQSSDTSAGVFAIGFAHYWGHCFLPRLFCFPRPGRSQKPGQGTRTPNSCYNDHRSTTLGRLCLLATHDWSRQTCRFSRIAQPLIRADLLIAMADETCGESAPIT
jgi:hypothetical protein